MIKTLLLDADGVLQHPPSGWFAGLLERTGTTVNAEIAAVEEPFMTGGDGIVDAYTAGFPNRTVSVEELFDYWNRIVVDAVALALIDQVRARGVRVFLASNQQVRRAAYMRDELPFSRHLDGLFMSAELGLRKPDPAFFARILDETGSDPAETLFIDDMPENAAAARAFGLNAEQVERNSGSQGLRAILQAYDLI